MPLVFDAEFKRARSVSTQLRKQLQRRSLVFTQLRYPRLDRFRNSFRSIRASQILNEQSVLTSCSSKYTIVLMVKTPSSEVYTRLAVLRAERNLSRRQVAEKVGVHYQTIGYLERGEYNPSLAMALRIAALFRLPVEAIFSLEPMAPLSEELYDRKDGTT